VDILRRALEAGGLERALESGLVEYVFAANDLLLQGEGREELAECLLRAASVTEGQGTTAARSVVPPRRLELSAERPEFNGEGVDRFLYPTGLASLRFLPLRGLGRAGAVSVSTLRGILERVRGEGEVTLVDTGPVPGAVEAPMVAASSDAVVLVVSPGDRRPDAESAVEHLGEVGARLAGVVLNRAEARDVLKRSRSPSAPPPEQDAS
jgi:hypothetical protein